MTQKRLIGLTLNLIKKLAYGFFILWIGFLAPLTFFNSFALSHPVQPYRIALFERMPQLQPEFPAELAALQFHRLTQQLTGQSDSLSNRGFLFSLAQSLLSSLSHLSFFGTALWLPLVLYLGRLLPRVRLAKPSTGSAPPDKPPRPFLLAV
ncbi:MAG TPA: hypothetical protein PKE64_02750 [Anaerolineae bacterium]|nr:hypothetical protein [Anaerolineae bacterium]